MNFTNKKIQNTYGGILNIGASGASGPSLHPVTDGFGTVLPIEISQTEIKFTGTVTGITGAISGSSGTSGINGAQGAQGAQGPQGPQGEIGATGSVGPTGAQGAQGAQGAAGSSGTSGFNGTPGSSGTSGTSGTSGSSGTSGVNGAPGSSGTSGTSGSSGTSGVNGSSGTSGVNGSAGTSGDNGSSGTSGTSGLNGDKYLTTSGNSLTISNSGTISFTVGTGLAYSIAQTVIIAYDASNHMHGTVLSYNSGTGAMSVDLNGKTGGGTYSTWTVNLDGASGGNGSSGTSGIDGSSGTSGFNGSSGTSGANGSSGTSGTSGISGSSGTSGTSGTSGSSGTSGINGSSGTSGVNGSSGTSGVSGSSGTSGTSGTSGISGSSGTSGAQGPQGAQGPTGPAGTGISGDYILVDSTKVYPSSVAAPTSERILIRPTSDSSTYLKIHSGDIISMGPNYDYLLGSQLSVTGTYNVAIGRALSAASPSNVLLGYGCGIDSSNRDSVAIGNQASIPAIGGQYTDTTIAMGFGLAAKMRGALNVEKIWFKALPGATAAISNNSGFFGDQNFYTVYQGKNGTTPSGATAGSVYSDPFGNLKIAGLGGTKNLATEYVFVNGGTASTPASGRVTLFADNSGDIKKIDSTGTVTSIGGGGGSGSSGTSGVNGSSGTSGIAGTPGSSGTSGVNGSSGTSGVNGSSGTSGVNGSSGTSGISGASGSPGSSGTSGTNGATGNPGLLGITSVSTSYSLQLTDAGNMIEVSSASPLKITVPDNGGVPFATGTNIMIMRGGTGEVGVTGAAGVNIYAANGYLQLNSQFSGASLVKSATNTWYLVGDLKA